MPSRPYAGHEDLVAMQRLMTSAWAAEGPLVKATPGDLHWWMYQHADKLDEVRIALWEDAGRLVGWSWLWLPQTLFSYLPQDERAGQLFEEMLDWFESEARAAGAGQLDVDVLDVHEDQWSLLERRGYRLIPDDSLEHMTCSLAELQPTPVAEGFDVRPVRLPEELEARVDVHRAAFAPSRVTTERYGNVIARPPYRPELDWVAVGGDGRCAAYALVWLDEANGVAELEPVGTHPDFRRRGLARAVCSHALAAARALGAHTGLVYAVTRSPAVTLYESLGFRTMARHVQLRREAADRAER